jgi:hypothetical protein
MVSRSSYSRNHEKDLAMRCSLKPLADAMIWFLIYVLAARTAADSSSRNAVNFSSARTTNRFPSSRCASTVNIVRPLESTA